MMYRCEFCGITAEENFPPTCTGCGNKMEPNPTPHNPGDRSPEFYAWWNSEIMGNRPIEDRLNQAWQAWEASRHYYTGAPKRVPGDLDPLACPNCGSEDYAQTCMGWIGGPDEDPNWIRCSCGFRDKMRIGQLRRLVEMEKACDLEPRSSLARRLRGEAPAPAALAVCRALVDFQAEYQANTRDKAPGNDFYAPKLLAIIKDAFVALAAPGESSAPAPTDGPRAPGALREAVAKECMKLFYQDRGEGYEWEDFDPDVQAMFRADADRFIALIAPLAEHARALADKVAEPAPVQGAGKRVEIPEFILRACDAIDADPATYTGYALEIARWLKNQWPAITVAAPSPDLRETIRQLESLIKRLGDAATDVFDQMTKAEWRDKLDHLVSNNTAMIDLCEAVKAVMRWYETSTPVGFHEFEGPVEAPRKESP